MMVIVAILLTADIGTAQAQQVALKTNLLYDATTTPNIGAEMGIGKKSSVQLFYGFNPWKFGHGNDMKYAKHWILNPDDDEIGHTIYSVKTVELTRFVVWVNSIVVLS